MKLAPLIQQASELAVPVIVLGEYQYGIRLSRHRTRYESWLTELLATCRLLVVDERTAVLYAGIRHELKRSGHPIAENDIWIAALARQHNSPLVTLHRIRPPQSLHPPQHTLPPPLPPSVRIRIERRPWSRRCGKDGARTWTNPRRSTNHGPGDPRRGRGGAETFIETEATRRNGFGTMSRER